MTELLRIHLGCGERYLEGYLNIDLPPAAHSIQQRSVADRHCDLLSLSMPAGSAQEVRLHHTFEHFQRPEACALLAGWRSWLVPGGRLRIEVPDLAGSAWQILNPIGRARSKAVARRHLFGSHEAAWAVHPEGYSAASLSGLVSRFGYTPVRIDRSRWRGTRNFELLAARGEAAMDLSELDSAAASYLSQFLVDDSESERRLLEVWLDRFRRLVQTIRSPEETPK